MGITIHYKGKLNSIKLIDSFLDEIEDIAKSMEWKYTLVDEQKEKSKNQLKGLFIHPHKKSEFLQLTVDLKGHLRNAFLVDHLKDDTDSTYYNSVKTQFAPTEIHIAVIKLFKYLKQKYITNLEVWDEGDYWNTGDPKLLQEKFDFLNKKLDEFGEMLDSIEFDKNDTPQSIADKIEALLKQNWKKYK